MIRFAQPADTERVIALWSVCFPGDEAFREWYFSNRYEPSLTLVDEENGTLCAMLQMLPYHLQDEKGIRPVTYIYGACTAPEYRRQHRMERLLAASFELDQQNGHIASVLIPQEEWLFDFYRPFGYETAFWMEEHTVSVCNTNENLNANLNVRSLTEADIPQMNRLYQTGKMQLLRSEEDWKMQLALFTKLGAGVFGLEQNGILSAYAFVWHDGAEKLWAQEAFGAEKELLCRGIAQLLHCETIKMTSNGTAQKLGCIRYHDDTPIENGYFNLLFN